MGYRNQIQGNGSVTECRDKRDELHTRSILELVSLSETGEYEDFPTGPMGMGYFVLWVNETGMLLTVKTRQMKITWMEES